MTDARDSFRTSVCTAVSEVCCEETLIEIRRDTDLGGKTLQLPCTFASGCAIATAGQTSFMAVFRRLAIIRCRGV